MLHLTRLFRAAPEQQQSGRQSIEAMDGAQILQVVLFGKDKHDRVVTVSATRMNLLAGCECMVSDSLQKCVLRL